MSVFGKWLVALAMVLALVACEERSSELDHTGRPVDGARFSHLDNSIKIGLPGARDEVGLVRLPDGSIGYVVNRLGAGTDRLLTPTEFAELVYHSRSGRGWFARLLNITSPEGIAWVTIGLLGQLIFTGRMLVQWLASEKSGRSVIPVVFWWMSLGGAVMLVIYFVWRRDIVGVVGQGTGLFIYARNLMLIRKSRGG
jgi:lipid-A-disaccharide synthase-like uncharacterized protein